MKLISFYDQISQRPPVADLFRFRPNKKARCPLGQGIEAICIVPLNIKDHRISPKAVYSCILFDLTKFYSILLFSI